MKKEIKILISIAIVLNFTGCSQNNISVSPKVKDNFLANDKILKGDIKYLKNNNSYLPNTIQNDKNSQLKLIYDYSVQYNNGDTTYDGLNLFNPIILFGFPMSNTGLMAEGTLTIKNNDSIEKINAQCISVKTRNIFDTGGTSDVRKQCLLKIRDSIDNQILQKYKGII